MPDSGIGVQRIIDRSRTLNPDRPSSHGRGATASLYGRPVPRRSDLRLCGGDTLLLLRIARLRDKGLQWKDVDFERSRLRIRRSKTPAGWREPSLNEACLGTLNDLRRRATELGFTEPDHFLLPWQGREHKIDPARAMASWRSAWRSLRAVAGFRHLRFHNGRHAALTRLCEAGQPDWVIQAQIGHVSAAMIKTATSAERRSMRREVTPADICDGASEGPCASAHPGVASSRTRPCPTGVMSHLRHKRITATERFGNLLRNVVLGLGSNQQPAG